MQSKLNKLNVLKNYGLLFVKKFKKKLMSVNKS